jgi:AraC family transcriptional regulator
MRRTTVHARALDSDISERMRFTLRASSEGRLWTGFDALVYDISAGIQERSSTANHTVIMHLSEPAPGNCRCDGARQSRLLKPGDIDFIPLGYTATWHDQRPGRVLNVRMAPSFVQTVASAMTDGRADPVFIPPQLNLNDPVLQHLSWSLVAELESGCTTGKLFAESIGTAIAAHLIKRYSAYRPLRYAGGFSRRNVRRVLDYIEQNLGSDLSLMELAAVACVSPSHFKALFKQTVGMPVHRYVLRRRVDYAVSLLSRDNARICDVALQAGFADQSHMARCMRRLIGKTPSLLLRDLR